MLDARDRAQERIEGLKVALITHDPARWLPIFYPQTAKQEVTEEDVDDEDVTFEFEPFDPNAAEGLLSEVFGKQGTLRLQEVDDGWR